MMRDKASKALALSWKIAWVGLLVCLPVTSFPFLSRLLGGAQVAPLALIPLAWLAITWLPYRLLKRDPILPAESVPLFVFILVATIASLLAFFLNTPPYKQHTIAGNEWSAFITLAIGLFFYLVVTTTIQSEGMDKVMRFISIGGMIILVWSFAQGAVVWFRGNDYPDWMITVHSWMATSSLTRLFPQTRVTGLAYEPSWLAHMLTMLYLPLWMAGCACRQSAFRFRLGKLMIEDILLSCGLLVIFMTFSRISLLAFMLALGWLILTGVHCLFGRLRMRRGSASKPAGKYLRTALALFILITFVVGFMGLLFGLSLSDARLVPLFQLGEQMASGELLDDGVIPLANRLNFAERMVYWEMGWRIFSRHPLLGVGLGNSGQYALTDMSHWGWEFMETRRILFIETFLPNTKSLWARLLSETGMLGTIPFLTWLIVLWVSARSLRHGTQRLDRTIGLAGQLMLVSLVVEGFSLDSFAMPYWWIIPGMLTAASFLHRQRAVEEDEP